MNQDQMYLITKIFNNETIITIWDNIEGEKFVSIVYIVSVISERDSVTEYKRLKLKAYDGKYYNTDVVNIGMRVL